MSQYDYVLRRKHNRNPIRIAEVMADQQNQPLSWEHCAVSFKYSSVQHWPPRCIRGAAMPLFLLCLMCWMPRMGIGCTFAGPRGKLRTSLLRWSTNNLPRVLCIIHAQGMSDVWHSLPPYLEGEIRIVLRGSKQQRQSKAAAHGNEYRSAIPFSSPAAFVVLGRQTIKEHQACHRVRSRYDTIVPSCWNCVGSQKVFKGKCVRYFLCLVALALSHQKSTGCFFEF